jgi:hypothetical protein
MVVLVVGVGLNALNGPAAGNRTAAPLPVQTADGWPPDALDGGVISAAATDADHLYAAIYACDWKGDVRHCTAELVGSDNGGRTWTVRQADFGNGQLDMPAPGVLLQTTEVDNQNYDGSAGSGPKSWWHDRISTDGGRTWRDVQAASKALAAVPTGGWLEDLCAVDQPCQVVAFDPATARSAPLASQPPLDLDQVADVPTSAGYWVDGSERGGSHLPAVAVSRDRGETWSVHTFSSGAAGSSDSLAYASVKSYSVDGRVGYAIVSPQSRTTITGPSPTSAPPAKHLVYRTTDGGKTWQHVDPGQTLPSNESDPATFIAADGTHVVLVKQTPQRWYASNDNGNSYHPVNLPGLSDNLTQSGLRAMVLVTAPGVYLAFDDTYLYRSADGFHWTRTSVQPR